MVSWNTEIPNYDLTSPQIALWSFSLDQPAEVMHHLASTLTPDESARSARFRFEHLRRHFTAGRGIMRSILSNYLHHDAAALRFGYTEHSKPYLLSKESSSTLHFNLSHSDNQALQDSGGWTAPRRILIIHPQRLSGLFRPQFR